MKTTAMKELIEWLYQIDKDEINIIELIEKAEMLVDKERDQIVDAWAEGVEDIPMSRILGELYYNRIYKEPFNPNLN